MDAGYRVSVNGVDADNQGEILINGEDIPLTDATGSPTVAAAVATLDAKDGSSILTGESGSSETILEAIERLDGEIETVGTFDTTLAEAGKGAGERNGCHKLGRCPHHVGCSRLVSGRTSARDHPVG
jgi:hypothetical protein